jgi:hypothetical protein
MTLLSALRNRLRLFVIPILAAGGLALSAQAVWACEVIGEDGNPRDCTFTEELGKCLAEADESYRACVASDEGAFVCGTGRFIDRSACTWESLGGILLAVLQ